MKLSDIRQAIKGDLYNSAIEKSSDIKKLGFRPILPEECEELTGYHLPAYEIPYPDATGRTRNLVKYSRLKFLIPPPDKPDMRYWQKAGTLPRAYFPPVLKGGWNKVLNNPNIPLFITEGEKKAASACIHGIPTIGLGGVWSFKSSKAGIEIIPELSDKSITWKNREVIIVYDNDVMIKADVMRAMMSFSNILRRYGVKTIKSLHLQALDENAPEKLGLDDFIFHYGAEPLIDQIVEYDELLQKMNELNSKYAVIKDIPRDGVWDMEQRQFIPVRGFLFQNSSNVIHALDGKRTKKTKVAEAWIEWTGRRELDSIVFAPHKDTITANNEFNLWQPYPYPPVRKKPTPFLDLLEAVIPEKLEQRWFLEWLAFPLQNAGAKMASAVIIWGEQGCGKSFLGKIITDMYGAQGRYVTQRLLEGEFNSWAEGAQFIAADEVIYHGDRQKSDVLKNMITQREITINKKYQPQIVIKDYTNYYFTSNHANAIHLESGDRRFFVIEAGRKKQASFYKRIDKWFMKNPELAYGSVLNHLNSLKLTMINDEYEEPPVTRAKYEMLDESRSSLDQAVADAWESPEGFFKIGTTVINKDLFSVDDVFNLLPLRYQKQHTISAVGHAIRRLGIANRRQISIDGQRKRIWTVRNHQQWKSKDNDQWRDEYLKESLSSIDFTDQKVTSIHRGQNPPKWAKTR